MWLLSEYEYKNFMWKFSFYYLFFFSKNTIFEYSYVPQSKNKALIQILWEISDGQ